jgi:two-component system, NarL family, response regulator LiaR
VSTPSERGTGPARPVRVVIADSDPLARRAIRDALQEQNVVVIAEVGNGRDAVELGLHYVPDVVLMEVALRELDGIAAMRRLHERRPAIAVVLLCDEDDDDLGLLCLRAGATGFLPKTVAPATLPRAVRAAAAGEPVITRGLTSRLISALRAFSPDGRGLRPVRSPLTGRQWEVLDLLCEGMSTDEIARTLVVSSETVRSHLKNIARALGVRSRQQAIEVAQQIRSTMAEQHSS